jgi:hypothetical protein
MFRSSDRFTSSGAREIPTALCPLEAASRSYCTTVLVTSSKSQNGVETFSLTTEDGNIQFPNPYDLKKLKM